MGLKTDTSIWNTTTVLEPRTQLGIPYTINNAMGMQVAGTGFITLSEVGLDHGRTVDSELCFSVHNWTGLDWMNANICQTPDQELPNVYGPYGLLRWMGYLVP